MAADSVTFDRAAEYYDATRGFPPGVEQDAAALISRVGGLTPESRVLEIGVGTGRIALPVSRYVKAYFGADISAKMLARLNAKRNGAPVYAVQADATRLPFPDNSFDVAVAVHVFHLIPAWQTVLDELSRVLRPDGKLLHCYGGRMATFPPLMTAWNAVIPDEERQVVGANYDTHPDFLQDEGWLPLDTPQEHHYIYQRAPQGFVEQLTGRIWSRTWPLSDTSLQAGIAAVQAALREHYPDPTALVDVEGSFTVHAFQPPSR